MVFRFDRTKALQAAAVLLKATPAHCMNYMRLIKLLYIAERESLKETGATITGDAFVAMQRGPVLSRVLNIIKGQDIDSPRWQKFLERDGYHVRLIRDPGNSNLCRYEIEKLQQVFARYRERDEWDMVNETHNFPEWQSNKPAGTIKAKPIPVEDILHAVGLGDEQVKEIIEESQAYADAHRLFESTG